MSRKATTISATFIPIAAVALAVTLIAGCGGSGSSGGGEPTFITFMSKSSKSYGTMKPIVDKLTARNKGKVVFKYYDFDAPSSKGAKDQYHVSMNPTFIILNTKGKVKEIYMGAAQEEMLSMAVESFIPGPKPQSSTPGSNQPGTPVTPGSSMPVQIQTLPVNPSSPGSQP